MPDSEATTDPRCPSTQVNSPRFWALAWLFLRIGATAFGGYLALLAVIEKEVVERRQWIDRRQWADGLSLGSTMPGPIAVNIIVYIGYLARGWRGSAVAGTSVLLPSFLLMILVAEAYGQWGEAQHWQHFFAGVLPALLAIVAGVIWRVGRKNIVDWPGALLALSAGVAGGLIPGAFIPLVFIVAAVIGLWLYRNGPRPAAKVPAVKQRSSWRILLPVLLFVATPFAISATPWSIGDVAGLFVELSKISVVLFGGGYVMIPLLENAVVSQNQWVSHEAFIHAIAIGQMTPGPILISAAFIGWEVAALPGALGATLGMYLAPAVLMIGAARLLGNYRDNLYVAAAMRGVNAAVVGVITLSVVIIGQTVAPTWFSVVVFSAAAITLMLRISPLLIIPLCGLVGLWWF